MKVCVSSFSYNRLIARGELSLADTITQAKEAGFEGIEFASINVPAGRILLDFAKELRQEADRLKMPIVNYSVHGDFLEGCGGNLQDEIERLKNEVDVAVMLGAPGLRHDVMGWGLPNHTHWSGFSSMLPRLASGCREVTKYAASFNVKTMVENHGYFCQDSARLEKLVQAVDHPNFGILLDLGNFYCVDEHSDVAVGFLAPYAFHVHAKDFHLRSGKLASPGEGWLMSRGGNFLRGAIIGHGDVPLAATLRALRFAGYDGTLAIEFEGLEDPLTGLRIGHDNIHRLIAMSG